MIIKNNKRKVARFLADAQEYMNGFGLDFLKLEPRIFWDDDEVTAFVIWTHNETGQQVKLSSIYWEDDGHIMQAGMNYGILTL